MVCAFTQTELYLDDLSDEGYVAIVVIVTWKLSQAERAE